jgi:hypothetical protein
LSLNVIPAEYIDLFEGGVSIFVGTRDAENRPLAVRAVGASVSKDRREVTVFLHESWTNPALDNLRTNGEIAVGFSRPMDHLSVQVKGKVKSIVPASEGARTVPDRYHASYSEQLYIIGLPRSLTKRINVWPAAAVTLEVASIFLQTPGPGAGRKLEART